MQNRNTTTEAIILKTEVQGEHNRKVCILSPESGIFYATLYGGPKSKLCSLVQPMNSGKLWIYSDNTRHLTKISDFDVKNYHLDIRQTLKKLYAAYLACEFVLKTKAAGDAKSSFILLSAFLDGLNTVKDSDVIPAVIRFLWRYINVLGIQPSLKACAHCGNAFFKRTEESLSLKYKNAVYIPEEECFLCSECAQGAERAFPINAEALTYIAAISAKLPPRLVRAIT